MTNFKLKGMKKYQLMLSKTFPSYHPKAGADTGFGEKLLAALIGGKEYAHKLHTIRANYKYWEEAFREIRDGKALLSVRQWTGKPYWSKQKEIARLTADDGIGLQKLTFTFEELKSPLVENASLNPDNDMIARFDGLTLEDWKAWFKPYALTEPMAIIHFTPFRY